MTPPLADVRILTDENISPNLPSTLLQAGIDALPLRDRAKLRLPDYQVFRMAQQQRRAVATINEVDFRKLAAKAPTHCGIITIPNGFSPREQAHCLTLASQYMRSINAAEPMLVAQDHIIAVDEDYLISRQLVRAVPSGLPAHPPATGLAG